VRYEQWPIHEDVPADADSDTVFAAYGPEIDKLNAEEGFTTVDVLGLHPSDDPEYPAKAAGTRAKFLQEHTHDDDDEVRFFVSGPGIFNLHVTGEVHAVYCEKGDLLGVPRGTTHWFDMGTKPAFTAIRFLREEDGWVGNFTGSTMPSLRSCRSLQTCASVAAAVRCGVLRGRLERSMSPLSPSDRQRRIHL